MDKFKNFSIFVFSILFSLYLLETILSLNKLYKNKYNSNYNDETELKSNNIYFDNRTKLEVFEDIKKKNKHLYTFNFVFKKIYLDRFNKYTNNNKIIPLGGKSKSKVIHCNESGSWVIYSSDRYGFNNEDKHWDTEKKKILLLGDSYTHGACVDYEFTLAGWFNKNLTKNSTLSVGSDGKGPLSSYASLKEYYPNNLSHVIYFYYEGNDLVELKREISNYTLSKYYSDKNFSQQLKTKQFQIDQAWNKMFIDSSFNLNKSRAIRFFQLRFLREKLKNFHTNIISTNQKYKINKKDLKQLEEILIKMKNFSEKNNSKFLFVYLPAPLRYFLPYNEDYGYNYYDDVIEIIKNNNIEYIDVYKEIFKKEKNPKNFFAQKKMNHYSETTYEKIVQLIIKNTNFEN